MLARVMPNVNAAISPLYPSNELIPYMMKTKAGVVKVEFFTVLIFCKIIAQKTAPANPKIPANINDETMLPKVLPISKSLAINA